MSGDGECDLGGSPLVLPRLFQSSSPGPIAVDATSVYWFDSAIPALMKGPLDGGATTILASASGDAIAVDATNVYWIADFSVSKVPIAGGATVILASGLLGPTSIAVDALNVYFTDGSFQGGDDIKSVPINGGAVTTITYGTGTSIAVDATSVYWASTEGVSKAPLGGGTHAAGVPR
jgi:hypothetical protein